MKTKEKIFIKKKVQPRRVFAEIGRQFLLVIASAMVLTPIAYIVMASFKTKMDYISNQVGIPKPFVLDNYLTLFKDGQLFLWFRNSILVTIGSVTVAVIIAALAAYAFSRINFTGREKIFNFLIALMIIPPIVMIIPLFVLATKAHLVNTYWSAIIIYTGLMLPFNIYLLRNFFVTIPESIVDSARIDGCGEWGIFMRIIIPLSKPALITLIVVSILWVWNELLIAMIFLQKAELTTLMVGLIQFQGKFRINQPVILAGIFTSMVPLMVIYFIGQKFFVSGLTAGALKGE
ncbi:MAG: carbohydrate ABC transporter permease [Candidatus Humimicrobiaceae bacterium]